MTELMLTKLMPPSYSEARLMARPRLLDLLTKSGGYKLILLVAPAGYGKTTLALQYSDRLGRPGVWYQLDQYDNDPAVFIHYLVAGVRRYLPDYGRETLRILAQHQGNIGSALRLIVTSLVNGLTAAAAESLLVLDDYHLISEPLIHRLLQELLAHLPAGISVLIASRSAPDLNLQRLRVAGTVAALGFEELRFNSQEIGEFLAHTSQRLSPEQLAELERQTAGWPAALCLLHQDTPALSSTLLNRGTAAVYDFLAAEILERQPEPVQRFLLESSVLEVITAADCDQLLERCDAAALIENLLQQQLFLIPLAGEERTYRYHHLFREFLRNRLGPAKEELYRRAGRLARSQENWEAAVEYFRSAGDELELVRTILGAGQPAFLHGRWQTVQRWLGLLEPETIRAEPWLALFQARVELNRGRLAEAQAWLEPVEAGFRERDDREGLAEFRLAQARLLLGRGRYQEAEDVLEQAGESDRFDVTLKRALIRFTTGKFKEAEQLLLGNLAYAERNRDDYAAAHILEALGHANYLLANFPRALQYYQRGALLCPDRVLPGFYVQDFRPAIYHLWGETEQAYEFAVRSLAAKEKLGLIDSLPAAYYMMAVVLVDRTEYFKAEEYYRRGINLARENGGDLAFLAINLAELALCYYLQENPAQARITAEEALQEAGRQSGLVPAVCRGLVALVYLETGDPAYAGQLLQEARAALERMGFLVTLRYVYLCLAYLHYQRGDGESFAGFAAKTLKLSAAKNFVSYLSSLYRLFAPVLRYGLEQGLEVVFVQKNLLRVGEQSLELLGELADHPDPQVRRRLVPILKGLGSKAAWTILQRLGEAVGLRAEGAAAADREAELRLFCLGPLKICCGPEEIGPEAWRIAKARELLLYLAHRGEMVGIDRVFEDLWPDLPPDKAQAAFYSALYWLRRILKPECGRRFVQYRGKRCGLLSESYCSDKQRFEALLAGGHAAIGVPEAEQARLEEATVLYRGDYLGDFDYPWALLTKEHCRRQFLEARIRLARIWLGQNQYARMIAALNELAQDNPLHEEIHRLLMAAYAGSGDRLAAANQYQILVRHLQNELELAPEPQTRELYYKLCGAG